MITGHSYHKDSFGKLQTALTGGGKWTMRLLRNTKMAFPHIAKSDVFTYTAQFNHDKNTGENADGFHIHFIPIGAVTGGEVIAIDYAWGWLTGNDTFPDTLPNTGTATITLEAGQQYKYLIKDIVKDLDYPENEAYSSEFFIECTRRSDGQDTYSGEFALLDGDAHYPSGRIGSYNEYTD